MHGTGVVDFDIDFEVYLDRGRVGDAPGALSGYFSPKVMGGAARGYVVVLNSSGFTQTPTVVVAGGYVDDGRRYYPPNGECWNGRMAQAIKGTGGRCYTDPYAFALRLATPRDFENTRDWDYAGSLGFPAERTFVFAGDQLVEVRGTDPPPSALENDMWLDMYFEPPYLPIIRGTLEAPVIHVSTYEECVVQVALERRDPPPDIRLSYYALFGSFDCTTLDFDPARTQPERLVGEFRVIGTSGS